MNAYRQLTGIFPGVALALIAVIGPAPAQAANGRLELTVVDKTSGELLPCRMILRIGSENGRARKPKGVPFWNDHFVFPGQITLDLPLGDYFFEIERGPEYVDCSGHFTIKRFADDAKQIELRRGIDMAALGWWSGDLDVRRGTRDLELLMRAEDLHIVPAVTWMNDQRITPGQSLPEQPLVRFDDNRFYHALGQGHRRAGGELLLFNASKPIRWNAAGPEFPPPGAYVDRIRQEPNGWVDLTRPYWWDLPAMVAHGQVDSIQIAHAQIRRTKTISNESGGKPRDVRIFPGVDGAARWSQEIYFHLLNCGLRIPPSAGSGSGQSPNPVGYNRVYVNVDSELTYQKWWQNLKAGRAFVTNGPMIVTSVEGHPPGHVFQLERGREAEFEVLVTNLSRRKPIQYIELIRDGRVEVSVAFDDFAKTGRLPKLKFNSSGWFLVRAVVDVPKTYRFAMTAPYYVESNYQKRISRRSAQFFLDWVYERARRIQLDNVDQQQVVMAYHREARDFWRDLVDRANAE